VSERPGADDTRAMTRHTHAFRLGLQLLALWAVVALFSFFPPKASAAERVSRVVVLEQAHAGNAPEAAVQRLGGAVGRQVPLVRGFLASVPTGRVAALRRTAGVRSVHADRRFALRSTSDAPATASTTLDVVRAAVGADRVAGGEVDVAFVDSGIAPVGALAGRVVNGPDLSADAGVDELRHLDAFGHGTHLAGIVAAVAPQARLVNVKVADSDGSTSLGRLLAGIDWVVRRGDVDVLNLAFGAEPEGSYRDDPLAFAAERAWQRGVVVVVAAGNGGAEAAGLDTPAHDPSVIAAGASDIGGTAELEDDGVALFSSHGSAERTPDVVAPGAAIVSTRVVGSFLDEHFPDARVGEDGFRGSGTSQAAAVVAGAAALLVGARPGLEPDQVKALLRAGARPLPGAGAEAQGAGAVDVAAAVAAAVPNERDVRQRHPRARLGGWLRHAVGIQYAVENLKGSRWSGSRWSGSRWSGSRWSGSRWSGSRWSGSRWSGSRWSGSRWSSAEWPG
jgi:subtilisin family serine protease